MTDEHTIRLTRRRALGGLAAIGVASAGAGLGTTAYFSDEEGFGDNSLTAGELDLYVHYEFAADQDGVEDENLSKPQEGTVQGDVDENAEDDDGDPAEVSYELTDVKPGDSGSLVFCFSIVDNPAYMWMCGALTANDQNGTTEPEEDALDELFDEVPDEGQLADAIDVTLSYCEEDDEDDGYDRGDEITSGSLREVLSALRNGVPLDGDGDGEADLERDPFDGGESSEEPTDETCVCLDWKVPTDVGNEIQTDSVAFDLSFYAEQSRHNDGTTNPCITGREGKGFAKSEEELDEIVWHARGIYADNDAGTVEAGNAELDIRDADDDDLTEGGTEWGDSGDTNSFELTIDDGDAIWSVDGDEIDVEDAPTPVADGVGVTVKSSKEDAVATVENINVNGSTPSGATSVSAEEETKHIVLEGATLQDGDVISGDVTFEWDDEPSGEELGFRVDV